MKASRYRQPGVKIYNRVRFLREERGISRKELASALGINHRTLGYIEREEYKVKVDLAYMIANYFGVPVREVFSDEPFELMSERLYGYPD
jgi:DNA-binding XRE family transcriptional regulator